MESLIETYLFITITMLVGYQPVMFIHIWIEATIKALLFHRRKGSKHLSYLQITVAGSSFIYFSFRLYNTDKWIQIVINCH